jgi:hypothetical protein
VIGEGKMIWLSLGKEIRAEIFGSGIADQYAQGVSLFRAP